MSLRCVICFFCVAYCTNSINARSNSEVLKRDRKLFFGYKQIREENIFSGENLPIGLTILKLKNDIKTVFKQNKEYMVSINNYGEFINANQYFVFSYTYIKKCKCVHCLESYRINNEFKFDMKDFVDDYSKEEKVLTMLIVYKLLDFIDYLDIFLEAKKTNDYLYQLPKFYHDTYNRIKDKYFFKDTIRYVSSYIKTYARYSFTGQNYSNETMRLFCLTNKYYTLLEKFVVYAFIKAYELTSYEKCKNYILDKLSNSNYIASANGSNLNVSAEQNTADPNGLTHNASTLKIRKLEEFDMRVHLCENWDYFNIIHLLVYNHQTIQVNQKCIVYIDVTNIHSILKYLNGFLHVLENNTFLTFNNAFDFFIKNFLSSTIGKFSFVFNNPNVVNDHNSNFISNISNKNKYKICILYDQFLSVQNIYENFKKQKHCDSNYFFIVSFDKIIKLCLYIQKLTFYALKYYFKTFYQDIFKFRDAEYHKFSTNKLVNQTTTNHDFDINLDFNANLFEKTGIEIAELLNDIRIEIKPILKDYKVNTDHANDKDYFEEIKTKIFTFYIQLDCIKKSNGLVENASIYQEDYHKGNKNYLEPRKIELSKFAGLKSGNDIRLAEHNDGHNSEIHKRPHVSKDSFKELTPKIRRFQQPECVIRPNKTHMVYGNRFKDNLLDTESPTDESKNINNSNRPRIPHIDSKNKLYKNRVSPTTSKHAISLREEKYNRNTIGLDISPFVKEIWNASGNSLSNQHVEKTEDDNNLSENIRNEIKYNQHDNIKPSESNNNSKCMKCDKFLCIQSYMYDKVGALDQICLCN